MIDIYLSGFPRNTKEELEILLDANIQKFLLSIYDKKYPIQYYEKRNSDLVVQRWEILIKIKFIISRKNGNQGSE